MYIYPMGVQQHAGYLPTRTQPWPVHSEVQAGTVCCGSLTAKDVGILMALAVHP